MKPRFKHPNNYYAIILALGSFAIGSLLLFLFKLSNAESLLILGLYYTILAVIVNTIMLLVLLINAITYYKDYPENLLTIFGLLVNIPITLWYIEIVF